MPDIAPNMKVDFYLYNALDTIAGGNTIYQFYPYVPISEDIRIKDIIYQFNKLGFDSICINPTWIEGNAYVYANGYISGYGSLDDLETGPLDINQSGIE